MIQYYCKYSRYMREFTMVVRGATIIEALDKFSLLIRFLEPRKYYLDVFEKTDFSKIESLNVNLGAFKILEVRVKKGND